MKFKRFMALAMAGVMTMGMTATALAAAPTQPTTDTPQAKKVLQMAEGVTVTQSFTFEGSAVKFNEQDTDYKNADGVKMPDDATSITATATVSFENKSASDYSTDNKNLANIEFKKGEEAATLSAGEYTFKLDEKTDGITPIATADNIYGWTLNTNSDSYYLHVYVPATGPAKYSLTKENATGISPKEEFAEFTNKFVKKGGSVGDTEGSLVISKDVDGDYADLTKEYTFTVTFDNSGDYVPAMPASGYPYTIEGGTSGVIDGNNNTTLILKDGQKAIFADIPAGVKVSVNETKVDNITSATIAYVSNGGDPVSSTIQAADGEFKVENVLIGEKANTISYTNKFADPTMTGLTISVAPFVAMFAAVGAAIALYVAAKRRVR